MTKTPRRNVQVGYTSEAVIKFLGQMSHSGKIPQVDWHAILGDKLPPFIWRKDWDKLASAYGLPWSRGHIANLDSRGEGPAAHMDTGL